MKKVLLIAICAVFAVSCASKRAGVVNSTITEAKVLQAMAKVNGLDVSAADALVASAEKQLEAGQTESAFIIADEATLRLQIALQQRENKNIEDSLRVITEYLNSYRGLLADKRAKR